MRQVYHSVNFASYAGFMVVICAALTVAVSICRNLVKPNGSAGLAGNSKAAVSLVAASGSPTPDVAHPNASMATLASSRVVEVEPEIHQQASNNTSSKDSVELPQPLPISKKSAANPPTMAASDSKSDLAVEASQQLSSSKWSATDSPAKASNNPLSSSAVHPPAETSSNLKTTEPLEVIARRAAASLGTHLPEEEVRAIVERVRERIEKEKKEEQAANTVWAVMQGESAEATEIIREALESKPAELQLGTKHRDGESAAFHEDFRLELAAAAAAAAPAKLESETTSGGATTALDLNGDLYVEEKISEDESEEGLEEGAAEEETKEGEDSRLCRFRWNVRFSAAVLGTIHHVDRASGEVVLQAAHATLLGSLRVEEPLRHGKPMG